MSTDAPSKASNDACERLERLSRSSFATGHVVHHIQARLAREGSVEQRGDAAVDDAGWIDIETDLGRLRRWTHEPSYLRAVLGHHGAQVELRSSGVLAVSHTTARVD